MDIADWKDKARYFPCMRRKIAYWTGGNPDARALLLVHGFPTCSWDWQAIWDTLCETRHVIACDMLGFGLSDKPSSGLEEVGYSIWDQAMIQEVLLKHLGITDFDALVHDYGVSVGQELLSWQQEGIGAAGLGQVVFLNGGIFPDQHRPRPMQRLGVSPFGFLLGPLMNRERFGRSFAEVFGPETQPSATELDEFWGFISHNNGHRIMHKLLHYMKDRVENKDDWEAALVNAQDKIGLINGALDPVSGKHASDKWREVLPGARHYLLPDVGHYPQVEAPERVAAKVLEWLGS